jgi:hypothetical protein
MKDIIRVQLPSQMITEKEGPPASSLAMKYILA